MSVETITDIPRALFNELVEKYGLDKPITRLFPRDPTIDRGIKEWCRLHALRTPEPGEQKIAGPVLLVEQSVWGDGSVSSALSIYPAHMCLTDEDLGTQSVVEVLLTIRCRHETQPKNSWSAGNSCNAAFTFSRGMSLMGPYGFSELVLEVLGRARHLALPFPTMAPLKSVPA